MQETINYIHQTSYIHSRFTKKVAKISDMYTYFDPELIQNQAEKPRSAEQILLDDHVHGEIRE